MTNSGKRLILAVGVGAVVGLFLTSSASGQGTAGPQVGSPAASPYPAGGLNAGAQNPAFMGRRAAAAPLVTGNGAPYQAAGGFGVGLGGSMTSTPYRTAAGGGFSSQTSPYSFSGGFGGSDPYGSYGASPYGPYYLVEDPWRGFMYGVAENLRAFGDFAVKVQESRLTGEQVRQARVDTRRRIYDQWLYERAMTPTNQDERERAQRIELRRALTDPPITEILSAIPINRIYLDLKDKVLKGAKGQAMVIDESILRQINVKARGTSGNIGVLKPLKDGGTMNWPQLLKGEAYQEDVKLINLRAAEAVKQAVHSGEVDPSRLEEMRLTILKMKKRLDENVTELTPVQWIEAKRFLTQLEDGRRALTDANVAAYFTDKFIAKGKTVPELVQYMASKGLEFAPATAGDEGAYMALYNSLLAYSNSIGSTSELQRDE